MKTIAFVPARCGSKAIPLKNIKEFCGKPLIYWVLAALEKVKQINEIYVATDCSEIKNIVAKFNFPKLKIYIRDPKNARDHSSTESVMLEFIRKKRLNDNDVFILSQATALLTKTADFIQALDLYYRKKADSLFPLSCACVKHFFWYETGKPMNYDYRKPPQRQNFKGILMENGAIYINTVGNIKIDFQAIYAYIKCRHILRLILTNQRTG